MQMNGWNAFPRLHLLVDGSVMCVSHEAPTPALGGSIWRIVKETFLQKPQKVDFNIYSQLNIKKGGICIIQAFKTSFAGLVNPPTISRQIFCVSCFHANHCCYSELPWLFILGSRLCLVSLKVLSLDMNPLCRLRCVPDIIKAKGRACAELCWVLISFSKVRGVWKVTSVNLCHYPKVQPSFSIWMSSSACSSFHRLSHNRVTSACLCRTYKTSLCACWLSLSHDTVNQTCWMSVSPDVWGPCFQRASTK